MCDYEYADGYDLGSSEGHEDGFRDAIGKVLIMIERLHLPSEVERRLLIEISKMEKY